MRTLLTASLPAFLLPLLAFALVLLYLAMDLHSTALNTWLAIGIWVCSIAAILFAFIYGRTRILLSALLVTSAWILLNHEVHQPLLNHDRGYLGPELSYLLLSTLLPLVILINSLWRERFHQLLDLILRGAFLGCFLLVWVAIAQRFPSELLAWLSTVHYEAVFIESLGLSQIAFFTLTFSSLLLLLQQLFNPHPFYATQLCGLLAICLALPHFLTPGLFDLIILTTLGLLIVALVQEGHQMAFRDDLTGLPGRRALNERLDRLGSRYTLVMGDVDHFKKFNDTHGHDMGDEVLRMVASYLRKTKGGAKAYRYGGEEFTLVFAGKTPEEALPFIEQTREAIAAHSFRARDSAKRPSEDKLGKKQRGQSSGKPIKVTISMGAAARGPSLENPEAVLKAADQALYKAKKAGRNRVHLHAN